MRILPVVASFSLSPLGSEAPDDGPLSLQWRIEPHEGAQDRIQFTLTRSRGDGHFVHIAQIGHDRLEGLTPAQLGAQESVPVRFRLSREAGAFDCEGQVRRRHGSGECRFEADAGFVADLARRGIGPATEEELFQLSLASDGLAFVDEVSRQGYAQPTAAELVRAANHGVGLDYLTEIGRLGYRAETLGLLVRMRDHGVSADYLSELVALGYGSLSAEEIVWLRTHDVTADFICRANAGGRRSADELVRLRTGG